MIDLLYYLNIIFPHTRVINEILKSYPEVLYILSIENEVEIMFRQLENITPGPACTK